MSRELAGRVAMVTGAGRNIGRAIALALADAGAAVAVNGRANRADVDDVIAEIESRGGKALAVMADVSDEAAVQRMAAAAVERLGRIDILVNNAAIRPEKPFESLSLADWRAVHSVILEGAFLTVKAVLPHLKASGSGAIVNIGGMSAYTGAKHRAHVLAAKSGLIGLTKALAHELAESGELVVADRRLAWFDAAELLLHHHHGLQICARKSVVANGPQVHLGKERQRLPGDLLAAAGHRRDPRDAIDVCGSQRVSRGVDDGREQAHVCIALLTEPGTGSYERQVVAALVDVVERLDDGKRTPELLLQHRDVILVKDAELELPGHHRGADVRAQADQLHPIELQPAGPDELLQRRRARAPDRIDADRLAIDVLALV